MGVSFTGAFTFFVEAFGTDWLKWWKLGRPATHPKAEFFLQKEQSYLSKWREIVEHTVWEYCDRHGLKRPNRCTTLKPSGSQTLLTGVGACGWHPPKAKHYIRRMTFSASDPIALAAIDYGYSAVPSQSCKDENGNLLDDINDPRVTEILIEVPVEEPWANLPGVEDVDPSDFPIESQWDFYLQTQNYYTAHNCFARNTEFLTDKGVKTFEDFEEGDFVKVLNSNGQWSRSKVVKTRNQREMYRVLLGRKHKGEVVEVREFKATECHRWDVFRSKRLEFTTVETKDLQKGMRIPSNYHKEYPELSKEGIKHGIVFGDGYLANKKASGDGYYNSVVTLYKAKRELKYIFEKWHDVDKNDTTHIFGQPVYFKTLPSEDESTEYIAGFIAGLIATDGSFVEKATSVTISTVRSDVVDWIKVNAPRIGLRITGIKTRMSGGGVVPYKVPIHTICLDTASLWAGLFVRSSHQSRFSGSKKKTRWEVMSVENTGEKEFAWCVMEPDTNRFTLNGNILTLNTSATLEIYEHEIEPLAKLIYNAIQNNEGYISAAILGRSKGNLSFPRLPFEPISKADYDRLSAEVLARRKSSDFMELLANHDNAGLSLEPQDSACSDGLCSIKK